MQNNAALEEKTVILELKHIYKDYIQGSMVVPVLKDINLQVEKGEYLAIMGPSGSGKSTLAKQINAILTPTDGTLYVDGMDVRDEKNIWDVRKTAGMVFQNPDNQIIGTVVEEDVGFGPENMGIPTEEIWERVEESLKSVGMWEYRKNSPNKLSGGQKQRIAIAGIIAMRPSCIVLDEPTAMLDPKGRMEVMKTIRMLNRSYGITIVLITHYMEEAAQADRVIVMDDGNILLDDRPEEVFSHVEQMKAIGLDVPQVTELVYELRQQGIPLDSHIISEDAGVEAILQNMA